MNKKYVCIDDTLFEESITQGKSYRVYKFIYLSTNIISHISIIDDNDKIVTYGSHRFREVKLYPNTKLFRMLYPNNRIVKNMIEV